MNKSVFVARGVVGGMLLAAGLLGLSGCLREDEAVLAQADVEAADAPSEEPDCDLCDEAPADAMDLVAEELEPPPLEDVEIQAPVQVVCSVSVRPPPECVAFVSSPVKMKCMTSSRTPGVFGCAARSRGGMACLPTTRYAACAENDYKDPRTDPLSTFSLDVDTASYGMMRRALMEGRLPDPRAVRLEEFVNFFAYDYPEPQGDEPVAVAAEWAECPWNDGHRLLRLGVKAKDLVRTAALPPCNLTFLIDVSGSMSGADRLDLAKSGLALLVEKLRPEDHVSIVTYASGTAVVLPATSGAEKALIRSRIERLRAFGGTNGGAGLELAYAEAAKHCDPQANNRVILITDGDFNIGLSGPSTMAEFIAEKRGHGIFLSVLGVGTGNYQDATMKRLANAGDGHYAYLDSLLTAKKVFIDEFSGSLYTVAKDVKLQVEFNPTEVAGYRLLGYENRLLQAKDFNDDRKDAGEVGSGHTMTAFYEIVPAQGSSPAPGTDPLKYQQAVTVPSDEIATLKLRWKDPDGEVSRKAEHPLRAKDLAYGEMPSRDFRFAASVAEFALLLSDSKFKGTANYASVLANARATKGDDPHGLRADFVNQVELAQGLGKNMRAATLVPPPQPIQAQDRDIAVEVDI